MENKLVLIFYIFSFCIFCLYLLSLLAYDNVIENFICKKGIEIVLARYEEDISWINEYPYNKCKVICYNKGSPIIVSEHVRIVELPNVGRCDHTYLYHIINNYDKLDEVTVFLPASCMDTHKKEHTNNVMKKVISTCNTVLIGLKTEDTIRNTFYYFQLDEWKATNIQNAYINPESSLEKCVQRPYGLWYDKNFSKELDVNIVCFWGIFAIAKEHIQQHPKEYYEKLIKYVNTHSNPEAGHYIERSWGVIFYPYPNECMYFK